MNTPIPTTPISLYIHFPWCIKKCPYCDFNSHAANAGFDANGYIDALIQDFNQSVAPFPSDFLAGQGANEDALHGTNINGGNINGREINTIFLGGGTPSLFSPREIARVLNHIRQTANVAKSVEITLEANPGALECGAFSGYREAGVNRISLGVQSFNDLALTKLGRLHNADTAKQAIMEAQTCGFDNLNLDIMFALPGQTMAQAMQDCEQALAFETSHLSCYQLTIEPNTLFHKQPPKLPDSDQQYDFQQAIVEKLERHGLKRYEVSAYAKPQKRCQHNLNYWLFGDYLGIGAGAHSKLSNALSSEISSEQNGLAVTRIWKEKQPTAYINKVMTGGNFKHTSTVTAENLTFEFMLNALRLKQGFSFLQFEARTGLPGLTAINALRQFTAQGWIHLSESGGRCSESGYHYIDEILTALLPD